LSRDVLPGGVFVFGASLGDHHLSYATGLRAGGAVVFGYVLVTCGAVVFSGYRRLAVFGAVNLAAVAVLGRGWRSTASRRSGAAGQRSLRPPSPSTCRRGDLYGALPRPA
jgi:hypothetical protein